MDIKIKKLVSHTPAKILVWRGKNRISYEAVFPDKYSIEGEAKSTIEEAKESFKEAWEKGIMTINGRFAKQLYCYWG